MAPWPQHYNRLMSHYIGFYRFKNCCIYGVRMEEYRNIKDFENYEVSNEGNVRNKINGKILKPRLRNNYYAVHFYKNKKETNKPIHRLVCEAFLYNPDNKPCIDHIDGDKFNNNLENLRWCNQKENCQNRKLSKKNTSGCKGVHFHKASNKWMAYITIDGIRIHLGLFENIEDARDARVAAANKAFGNFTNACELLKS